MGAALFIPVRRREELTGVIALCSAGPRARTQDAVATCQDVGDQLAVAEANAAVESERRDVDVALPESGSVLRAATWAADVGIWSWDVNAGEGYLSSQLKGMLGYGPEAFTRRWASLARRIRREDLRHLFAQVRAALESSGDNPEVELRCRHRDGHGLWILSWATIERDARGRALRMLGGLIDITLLKAAQEQLRSHRDELER